jgi:predicted phage terminase large subunit-like protein
LVASRRTEQRHAEQRRLALLKAVGGSLRQPYPSPFQLSTKQEVFLRTPQLEAFFGGSAGPGKSTALLASALMYADEPGYAALLLRRTYPQLSMPGGLIPMSKEWLGESDASWSESHNRWTFPSGATVTFGHIQNEQDVYRYLGQEYQFIGFDELTGFTETMYRYLFSRLRRSEKVNAALRMRGASNPGGIGHDWVKRRFITSATREPGTAFVRAVLTDNPGLDVDAYREGLAKLHPVIRRQLEDGDWDIAGEGTLFRRSELLGLVVPSSYPVGDVVVRAWDLAATAPHEANRDPDYTVGLKADWDSQTGVMVIRDVIRDRLDPDGVDQLMRAVAVADGRLVLQRVEQEGGSSGKLALRHVIRNLDGYAVEGTHPTGSKELRSMPFASLAGNGGVRIVEAPWTMAYIDELSQFPGGPHDDAVDCSSSAHEYLTSALPVSAYAPDESLRVD